MKFEKISLLGRLFRLVELYPMTTRHGARHMVRPKLQIKPKLQIFNHILVFGEYYEFTLIKTIYGVLGYWRN